jgi:hypothetical protein
LIEDIKQFISFHTLNFSEESLKWMTVKGDIFLQALNYWQILSYSDWLHQTLVQSQLQDCWTDGKLIVLELYKTKTIYLILNPNMTAPNCAVFFNKPPIKKLKKPLTLFLNSRAKNSRLTKVFNLEPEGRVINFEFGNDVLIKFILVPRQANIIVSHSGSQVAWEKPSVLAPHQAPPQEFVRVNWADYGDEYFQEFFNKVPKNPNQKAPDDSAQKIKNLINKKQKALEALAAVDFDSQIKMFSELGEELKVKSFSESKLYQPKLSKGENIKIAFQKVKDLKRKKQGAKERSNQLKSEIHNLESGHYVEKKPSGSLLKSANAKGRTFRLNDAVTVECGKSGADNLKLLRKASGWHLWLHLRDFPGSHAIMSFAKNLRISNEDLHKAAVWLIEETIEKKSAVSGLKYDVLAVECRFVKPIKGDKLGRVTFQNEKVFSVASRSRI